jgi:hypothetical protein
MSAFKARHALMSASVLKAAARLPPQARCLCVVQLVRSVSPREAFQSHRQHGGASFSFLKACCAAGLVSAALAHDGEAAAEAAENSGITDVAGVVRWASLARMRARAHARAKACTHTHTLRCLAARHGLV